jgi:hypothetical protein
VEVDEESHLVSHFLQRVFEEVRVWQI